LLNGRPTQGRAAAILQADLSRAGAAYRLSGRCSQDGGEISFEIYMGERQDSGEIRFRSGRAAFLRGRAYYDGLRDSNAETFWYR
jgi:hypothetical protein